MGLPGAAQGGDRRGSACAARVNRAARTTCAVRAVCAVRAPKAAVKSDRQIFFELKFNELDRGLTPEERQEWNSIYASYRGRSALTGTIIGVDPRSIYVWNPRTEKKKSSPCTAPSWSPTACVS